VSRYRDSIWRVALLAGVLLVAGCTSSATQTPDRTSPGSVAQTSETVVRTGPESAKTTLAAASRSTPGATTPAGGMASMPGMGTTTAHPFSVPPLPPTGTTTTTARGPAVAVLPGMPPVADPHNIYADAGANMISAVQRNDPAYAYVPHNKSGDVWVIDQKTFAVVRKCHVGIEIQHVVPDYDMTMLYATDDMGNQIRAIDPATGTCGKTYPVKDPYNMYFTPDGKYAISVAEKLRELVWYDPKTWKIKDTTDVSNCQGIDHADFSVDGKTAVFTCEFGGRVVVLDVATHQVIRTVDMPVRHTVMGPQDIKLAPDGSSWYIADSESNGVWVLNADATKVVRHIATGRGAHGLYLSRNAQQLYVTNRHEGSVSVLNSYTGAIEAKWTIPGGGSPDMGNVSADGTRLWVSGRYDNVVYVFDTRSGAMITEIRVGDGPHGLALMPLPGRYSLGHTGITR
jgi:YVTN family beta-propeller protein